MLEAWFEQVLEPHYVLCRAGNRTVGRHFRSPWCHRGLFPVQRGLARSCPRGVAARGSVTLSLVRPSLFCLLSDACTAGTGRIVSPRARTLVRHKRHDRFHATTIRAGDRRTPCDFGSNAVWQVVHGLPRGSRVFARRKQCEPHA